MFLKLKPYFELLNKVPRFLPWSLTFHKDCLSHLMGLFLLYIKQHEVWNHPTLDDCKALMRLHESTGFNISDWNSILLLSDADLISECVIEEKNKLDLKWHHKRWQHEKPHWCDTSMLYRHWQQMLHPRDWTWFNYKLPLKMLANLQGSSASLCECVISNAKSWRDWDRSVPSICSGSLCELNLKVIFCAKEIVGPVDIWRSTVIALQVDVEARGGGRPGEMQ